MAKHVSASHTSTGLRSSRAMITWVRFHRATLLGRTRMFTYHPSLKPVNHVLGHSIRMTTAAMTGRGSKPNGPLPNELLTAVLGNADVANLVKCRQVNASAFP